MRLQLSQLTIYADLLRRSAAAQHESYSRISRVVHAKSQPPFVSSIWQRMVEYVPLSFHQRLIERFTETLYLLSGIDLGQEGHSALAPCSMKAVKLRKFCVLTIRSLLCIELLFFTLDDIAQKYSQLVGAWSSSDVIKLVFTLIYPMVNALSMKCLWANQGFLSELFGKPHEQEINLNFKKQLSYLLGWAMFTHVDVIIALRSLDEDMKKRSLFGTSLPQWMGMHCKQCQYLVFLIFSKSQVVLRGRLNQLESSVEKMSYSKALDVKHKIRHITGHLNKTFSMIFALLYVKVFVLLYIFLCEIHVPRKGTDFGGKVTVDPVVQVLMLYDLASGGSEIVNACRRTATKVMVLNSRQASENISLSRLAQVLSYDELQDSLKVDCFTLTKQSLLSYVATVVTCIAVILQLDYRILAELESRKDAYLRISQNHSSTMHQN